MHPRKPPTPRIRRVELGDLDGCGRLCRAGNTQPLTPHARVLPTRPLTRERYPLECYPPTLHPKRYTQTPAPYTPSTRSHISPSILVHEN